MSYQGYKVIVINYSGDKQGDDEVWINKDAAVYFRDLERQKASEYARSEEAPEIKFKQVNYEFLPGGEDECRVGRVIHKVRRDKRVDLVKQNAIAKLTLEEREVLNV